MPSLNPNGTIAIFKIDAIDASFSKKLRKKHEDFLFFSDLFFFGNAGLVLIAYKLQTYLIGNLHFNIESTVDGL